MQAPRLFFVHGLDNDSDGDAHALPPTGAAGCGTPHPFYLNSYGLNSYGPCSYGHIGMTITMPPTGAAGCGTPHPFYLDSYGAYSYGPCS